MKNLTTILLVAFALSACCKNVYSDIFPYAEIKFLSKTDSSNLLFGDKKKYNYDSKMFFELYNSRKDTFYLNNSITTINDYNTLTKGDSLLGIDFSRIDRQIYVKFATGMLDSMQAEYGYTKSKDGNVYRLVSNIKYNGISSLKGGVYEYVIYK